MSSTKKLTFNAASAIIQVLFTGVLYFVLYKYLIVNLGVEMLGVWSLILSFSSIANLANLGITSGLVKFVAEYLVVEDHTKLGKLIFTSLVSMFVFFGVVSLIILFGAQYFLHYVIDKEYLSVALLILPYSLGSLSINAVGGIFTSVIEGHQKNYLRNLVYIISGIIMFVFTVLLTPKFQLQGVAIAQLIQAVFILLSSMILMFSINPHNHFRYWKWNKQSFNELFNYGYKFQVVSICQLLYEPTTKLLLSKFGGFGLLGHYEMANRLVGQFRALIVNANQVVIPVVAEKSKTQTKEHLQEFYSKMNRILLFFTLPLSTVLVVLTPVISILWLGKIEPEFIYPVYILLIAAILNIMCGPSYFSCLGEGRLSILVITHIGMAIINLLLGLLLGWLIGGYGIVLGWGLALSFGSIYLIKTYSNKIRINYLSIFTKNDSSLMVLSFFIITTAILLFSFEIQSIGTSVKIALSCVMVLFYLPVILTNDNFKFLLSILRTKKNEY
jgi:O-antigen/teichoic acid export membrane protein